MLVGLIGLALASGVTASPAVAHLAAPHATEVYVRNETDRGVLALPRVRHLDTTDCAWGASNVEGNRSAAGWISTASAVWLAPGGSVPVSFTADPPPEASGGYSAIVVFDLGWAERPDDPRQSAWGRIGVPVLVHLGGSAHATLSDVTVDGPGPTTPLEVTARAANTGETHLRVALDALVLDSAGLVQARLRRANSVWLVPGASCEVRADTWAWFEDGPFSLQLKLEGTDAHTQVLVDTPE